MTRPYSHHVKTAGGWRAALQGAANAGRSAASAAGRAIRDVTRTAPPRTEPAVPWSSPVTRHGRESLPEHVRRRHPLLGDVPDDYVWRGGNQGDDWHITTPRSVVERIYGPDLTEKLRLNAIAAQRSIADTLPKNIPQSTWTNLPEYSTEMFDRPMFVEQGKSPTWVIAHARPTHDIGRLTEQQAQAKAQGMLPRPGDVLNPVRETDAEVELKGILPGIRMDVGTSRNGTFTNPKADYNSTLLHEATHRLQRPPYELGAQRILPGEDASKAVPYEDYGSAANSWSALVSPPLPYSRFPIEHATRMSQAKAEYYQRLPGILSREDGWFGLGRLFTPKAELSRRAGEAMNFNDPANYQRFLDYMGSWRKGPNSKDVDWMLKLPAEERDLLFKGIVSSQPYSEYRA